MRDALPHLGPPGVALDLASGAGPDARFLADRGWKVLALDLSIEGLRRMRAADRPGRNPWPVLGDAATFRTRPAAFDLVVNHRFLLRESFALIRESLRPGGLLLFETFSVIELEELGAGIHPAFTLRRGELLEAFVGWEILLHEEGVFEREEGERGLARLIARKPPLAR